VSALHTFIGHSYWINSVAISPDGHQLLTGSLDASAWLWDIQTGQVLQRFSHDPGGVANVTFSPDGHFVLTSGWDGTAKLWDARSGELQTTFGVSPECCGGSYSFFGVDFSPDGQSIITGGYDGVMRLWDIHSGKELRQFIGHTDRIYGVAFSPDGQFALSAGNDETARSGMYNRQAITGPERSHCLFEFCSLLTRWEVGPYR
jgi:WD40 repeat protein